MVSFVHEAPLELLRLAPHLVATVLGDLFGVALPAGPVRIEDSDLSLPVPTELSADLVAIVASSADGGTERGFGIIIEAQRRPDSRKRATWPLYAAALGARANIPVCVLVLTFDEATTRWASDPISIGPGHTLCPFVLGPGSFAAVPTGAPPEWYALAALLGITAPGADERLEAAFDALAPLDGEARTRYSDLLMVAAKQAAPALWEQIMQKLRTRYQYPMSDFAREHYFRGHAEGAAQGEIKGEIKGKLEGEARAILAILEARAIPVDDTTRARILATTDPDLLDRWIALAVRCAAVEELFAEPAAK